MARSYRDIFVPARGADPNAPAHPEYFATRPTAYDGSEVLTMTRQQKVALLRQILAAKLHGIAFSPYVRAQRPGVEIDEEQIRERLALLAPHTRWIRTFSCIEGNQSTARIAHEMGLKTMVGVGIGDDRAKNEEELANGIEVAKAGHADILAVGNEVLLRGDLSENELIGYIEQARAAAPGTPVSYVDAYFLFEQHPRVTAACDVLLVNCYPFWERCPLEHSLHYMQEMVRRTQAVAGGKKVIISETGWPSAGTPYGNAVPGEEAALTYFINASRWAEEAGIELFFFSSFDESWKIDAEGDVGAYWGLWDNDGNLKYD